VRGEDLLEVRTVALTAVAHEDLVDTERDAPGAEVVRGDLGAQEFVSDVRAVNLEGLAARHVVGGRLDGAARRRGPRLGDAAGPARPAAAQPGSAQPLGELTYAMHVTVASAWFDPADNTGIATPFMVQEALHDALVKPMPQNPMAPSLAESWTESPDGLSYE